MTHYGNFNVSANIKITGSKFYDCSFSKGLLYVPPFQNFSNFEQGDVLYRYQLNQNSSLADFVTNFTRIGKLQNMVKVYGSSF